MMLASPPSPPLGAAKHRSSRGARVGRGLAPPVSVFCPHHVTINASGSQPRAGDPALPQFVHFRLYFLQLSMF